MLRRGEWRGFPAGAFLTRYGGDGSVQFQRANTYAPLCGWLAGRAERVSSQLLAATSRAGAAAAWTAVAVRTTTGSTTATAGETATTAASTEAVLVAAVVGVRRRHRGNRVVALPRASFELQ